MRKITISRVKCNLKNKWLAEQYSVEPSIYAIQYSSYIASQNVNQTDVQCSYLPMLVSPVVNGMWADWMVWSQCSTTCGEGVKTRFRLCSNPKPAHGGSFCDGEFEKSTNCSISPDITNCTSKLLPYILETIDWKDVSFSKK